LADDAHRHYGDRGGDHAVPLAAEAAMSFDLKVHPRRCHAGLALHVTVVLVAIAALVLSTGVGLVALGVCWLVGASEGAAHKAFHIASGIGTGGVVAGFFALGRWSRRSTAGSESSKSDGAE
jgi:hypothetical protein